MRIKAFLAAAFMALSMNGCSIADHFQARDRMDKSGDAYRNCVASNLRDPSVCEPLKAIYENDKAAYERT
jgi:hypothetical protein